MMQYNIYYNIEPDYWGVAPCWIIGGGGVVTKNFWKT